MAGETDTVRRTLVIGAGEAGEMIGREIRENARARDHYRLVAFLDDDPGKKILLGLPVFTGIESLPELAARERIQLAVIAIPSATREQLARIVDLVLDAGIQARIVPGVREIIDGAVGWHQLRQIAEEDLLGREEIAFAREAIEPWYRDAVVLVSGGGGSIGSELCRQLLSLPVARVVALGHGENSLYRLRQEFPDEPRLACELADVQDGEKLHRLFDSHRVSDVIHAAAHKHVPLLEDFPDEAVKNNVFGTMQAALAAVDCGVRSFLLVSTDKAVRARSVMGASKRVAERIVLGMQGERKTKFSLTRFGNVLGSRGSVLPLFREQIARGGPLTITHPEIERYFMSIREAARLVLQAASLSAGRVFVLDMGRPIRIHDLATRLVRLSGYAPGEIPIEITGLRPGEKLQEELFLGDEVLGASPFPRLLVAADAPGALCAAGRSRFFERATALLAEWDREGLRRLLLEYAEAADG